VAADGQTPVTSASAVLIDSQGSHIQYAYPDQSGHYSFGLQYLNAAAFQVQAYDSADGISATASGTVPSVGASLTIDIVFPLSVVRGHVRFADGTAVPNPSVVVVDAGGRSYHSTVATSAGEYAVLNAAVGAVTVTAQDSSSGLNATVTGTLVAANT